MNNEELKTFNGTPYEDIIKNLPVVDKDVNEKNIKIFDEYGTDCSSQERHKCVLCGNMTCIDDSISDRGNKLICMRCVYRYFEGDYSIIFNWNSKGVEEVGDKNEKG